MTTPAIRNVFTESFIFLESAEPASATCAEALGSQQSALSNLVDRKLSAESCRLTTSTEGLSGTNLDIRRGGSRIGQLRALLPETIEMKRDGVSHLPFRVFAGCPRRDAAGHVRRVRGEPRGRRFDHNEISHDFSPACFRTLFSVLGARSSPGLPATVTSPDLDPCLNCR